MMIRLTTLPPKPFSDSLVLSIGHSLLDRSTSIRSLDTIFLVFPTEGCNFAVKDIYFLSRSERYGGLKNVQELRVPVPKNILRPSQYV